MQNHISSSFFGAIEVSQTTKNEEYRGNHAPSIFFHNEDHNWETTRKYALFVCDDVDFIYQ